MLTYTELQKNATRFLSMTGLTVAEFEALLPAFAEAWAADVTRRTSAKPRQRKAGGGRKATLKNASEKLLFILVYFKLYPLQEAQGAFFGLSQSQTNEWIQRLTLLLQTALGSEKLLPSREPSTLAELLAEYDLLEFTIDGTERRIQRPKDAVEQKAHYSGKKKAYTLTNNVITHLVTWTVCYLSQTYPGSRHDKRICDEEGYTFPLFAELFQDTGFQGYYPEEVITYQPTKKPRHAELDIAERFINKVISSVRIRVENILSAVKRCHIVKDIFRNHRTGFDDTVMQIACGLHNLRVRHRHPDQHFDLLELAT